jgi:serine-type D-Ala-D-Ala carboxypeptidase (penicillin-binding protein 5/6)
MRILGKTVLSCLVLLVLSVAVSAPRDLAAKTALLTSQHKHNPQAKPEEPRSSSSQQVVSLQRAEEIKSRPDSATSTSYDILPRQITARSAIVLDAVTGEALYAVSPDLVGQPASTIKVLTGLLAINTLKKQERVTVSKRAAGMPRSKIYLQSGKSYTADDLINAVLLSSANDASVALAEKIGGSESVFASLMTHKARELGACNTVCKTANGLTAPGQQSTARDLAVVFKEIMKNQEFAERIRKTKVRTAYGGELRNHNRALWEVAGAEGGKTGFTRAAKQTYVGKFRRGDNELLVAIMGSETMWKDVNTLVEHGFSRKDSLVAGNANRQRYSSEIIQLKQLGNDSSNPLLVVLTDSKKISTM